MKALLTKIKNKAKRSDKARSLNERFVSLEKQLGRTSKQASEQSFEGNQFFMLDWRSTLKESFYQKCMREEIPNRIMESFGINYGLTPVYFDVSMEDKLKLIIVYEDDLKIKSFKARIYKICQWLKDNNVAWKLHTSNKDKNIWFLSISVDESFPIKNLESLQITQSKQTKEVRL